MPTSEPNVSDALIVDALTLGRSAASRDYQFRQRRFARLSGVAVSDQPALDVQLQFDLQRGRAVIRGHLQGNVELICQRCMAPMQYPLDEPFALLIGDVAETARSVEDSDDDVELEQTLSELEDWVADATCIDLVDIVEEQIILALPLVPKHESEQICIVQQSTLVVEATLNTRRKVGERSQNDAVADDSISRRPFANLRELLNK